MTCLYFIYARKIYVRLHLKTVEMLLKGYSRAKAEPMSNLKAMGGGEGQWKVYVKGNPPTLDNFDAAKAAT